MTSNNCKCAGANVRAAEVVFFIMQIVDDRLNSDLWIEGPAREYHRALMTAVRDTLALAKAEANQ